MKVSVTNRVLLISAVALSAAALSAIALADPTGSAWGGGTDSLSKGTTTDCSDTARYKITMGGKCVGNPTAVNIDNVGGEHVGEIGDSRDGAHPDTDYVRLSFTGKLPEGLVRWLHPSTGSALKTSTGLKSDTPDTPKPETVTIDSSSSDKTKALEVVLTDAVPVSGTEGKTGGLVKGSDDKSASTDSEFKLRFKSMTETDTSGKGSAGGTSAWGK